MGRILAWTPSLTGGIVVVRDPCLHGRFSIGSLCVGPSDTMSWSPTIGLLITPQESIQLRPGARVERLSNTFRTEVKYVTTATTCIERASTSSTRIAHYHTHASLQGNLWGIFAHCSPARAQSRVIFLSPAPVSYTHLTLPTKRIV